MSKKKKLRDVTDIQALIISLLIENGKMYGLEMVKASGGLLKRGTIYVTLDRMEDSGFISSSEQKTPKGEKGPPRRTYKVTGYGASCYAKYIERRNLFGAKLGDVQ